MAFNAGLELLFRADAVFAISDGTFSDNYRVGNSDVPEMEVSLTEGTSLGQATKHYHALLTLSASGGGSDTIALDLHALARTNLPTLDMATKVKTLIVRLRDPATGKKIVMGGGSNPFAPWLSTVAVTEDVSSISVKSNEFDGWTVPATALLKFTNPTANQVLIDVSITGY